MDRVRHRSRRISRISDVFQQRLHGGRDIQLWDAGADRRAGQQLRIWTRRIQGGQELALRSAASLASSEAYIPQDMNYPAVRLHVDRVHAAE